MNLASSVVICIWNVEHDCYDTSIELMSKSVIHWFRMTTGHQNIAYPSISDLFCKCDFKKIRYMDPFAIIKN